MLEETLFDRAAPWTLMVLTSPSDPIVGRADLTLALPAPAPHDGGSIRSSINNGFPFVRGDSGIFRLGG